MIDAPISASNINERNKKIGIRIFPTDDQKFTIGIRGGKDANNYSINFLVNF